MQHQDPNNNNDINLANIPNDIKGVILDYLSPVAQFSLVRCFSFFYKYAKVNRENIFKIGDQFLLHVLNGDIEQAKCMVSELPLLLLYKGSVQDSLGRTFSGTALQLALGAKDIKMCEMLKPFFSELKTKHPEEAKKQINERFPSGFKLKKKFKDRFNIDVLIDVVTKEKFIDDSINETTKKALEDFRQYFKNSDVVHTGYHFEADQLINAHYASSLINMDKKQRLLYKQEVLEFLKNCLPPHYLTRLSESKNTKNQTVLFKTDNFLELHHIFKEIEQELDTLVKNFNTSEVLEPHIS